MMLRIGASGVVPAGETLQPILARLRQVQPRLARIPVTELLDLFDDFGGRLVQDERTRTLEGVMFLSAWLKRRNLQKLLELNLHGNAEYLDHFLPEGRGYLAAKPQGLVAMWMAGNVATLPMFSLVPALLAKNVCLVKLAHPDPEGMDRLLAVLADAQTPRLTGEELLLAAEVVWFEREASKLHAQMSLAADVKILWGGDTAIHALTALPRSPHCSEIVFGPKYSLGILGRAVLEGADEPLTSAVDGFVRDIAVFDQRACSSPQTIFVERSEARPLRAVGELFARQLERLPPKPELDAYTTTRILDVRALWALGEQTDVIASRNGTDWTVCLDRELSLKEAIHSRTVFLTEVGSWKEILPLLSPKTQTVGVAMGDVQETLAFAELATEAGVSRCVRPGIMNVHESPWDGKLLVSQLVRWVTAKP
jgi:hypothetical protein